MKKEMTAAQVAQLEEMRKVWGSDLKMVDYCMKSDTPYLLPDGRIFCITKPSIKKDFCFGYHTECPGRGYEEAEELREKAAGSESYFIQKNTEALRERIKKLKDEKEKDRFFLYVKYTGGQNQMDLEYCLNYTRTVEANANPKMTPVTDEVRGILLAAYETELAKLEKRLATYLKKNGLSKLNTWTYWADR